MAIYGLPMWPFPTPPIHLSSTSHMEVCMTVAVLWLAVSSYKLVISCTWTIMASCNSHTLVEYGVFVSSLHRALWLPCFANGSSTKKWNEEISWDDPSFKTRSSGDKRIVPSISQNQHGCCHQEVSACRINNIGFSVQGSQYNLRSNKGKMEEIHHYKPQDVDTYN